MAGRKSRAGREGWTGSRPPFAPGNTVNVTHGAYSDAVVVPAADRVIAEIQGSGPEYLRDPMFGPMLRLASRAVAKSELVSEHLDSMPLEEQLMPPKPGTAAPVETDRKMSAHAMQALSRLGLTPDSAAKMTRQMTGASVDVAKLMAEMQAEDPEDEP